MALAAHAQGIVEWQANVARWQSAEWDCGRGETLRLMPSFLSGRNAIDLSGLGEAAFHWQTNGMGGLYWSVPARIDTGSRPHRLVADFEPWMDCGAAKYDYFFRAGATNGPVQYRAHGTIRMCGAPGKTPNALPLPVPVLDFAKIAWTNAPWGEGGGTDGEAVTNIVNGIVADVLATNTVEEVDPVFADWKNGDRVMAGNGSAANSDAVAIGPGARATGSSGGHGGASGRAVPEAVALGADAVILARGAVQIGAGQNAEPDSLKFRDYQLLDAAGLIPDGRLPDNLARTDNLGSAAYKDASEFATATDEALVYQLMMGSNVVAEVTNYNSSARSPQLRLLQLEEGKYKVVWAETNGLSRVLKEANQHADDAVEELASRKADRNWGKYTSGLGADAPSNTTWVSTPVTVIAGGYEYARVITTAGEAWVLCSNGMSAGPDTNAYFRVATLDGESLFSVERSESVLIGVDAGGITCRGNTVSIPLDVVSAEAPVCYACDDLVSQNWVNLSESLPPWITSATAGESAGSWVWTIETTARAGFFQFRALQEGRTVIRNNAPAELSQGIWVNGIRYVPVANGSTLTWTLAQ